MLCFQKHEEAKRAEGKSKPNLINDDKLLFTMKYLRDICGQISILWTEDKNLKNKCMVEKLPTYDSKNIVEIGRA